MRKALWLFAAATVLLFPTAVLADSISPTSYTATLNTGESATITKTVTVSSVPTGVVDVFFLADCTGSMGGAIAAVKANATNVMNTLVTSLPGASLQFGVGSYRDFPTSPYGGFGDYPFRVDQTVTSSVATAQAGINTWAASGGSDGQESNLYALQQAAGAAPAWRTGSQRIIVWFGDYPGHDTASEPAYPGTSEAAATAALVASNITVEAISAGSPGLNAAYGVTPAGQAGRITAATGGTYFASFGSSVADTIIGAIETALSTYSNVSLDVSEALLAGVGVSVAPVSYAGSYDRSTERTFSFDVTFTGGTPGTHTFDIHALVDGGRVAAERDTITTPGGAVPEAGTLMLLGSGLAGLIGYRRRTRMM